MLTGGRKREVGSAETSDCELNKAFRQRPPLVGRSRNGAWGRGDQSQEPKLDIGEKSLQSELASMGPHSHRGWEIISGEDESPNYGEAAGP
ncbi:hypothetical protein CRG98_007157 [Punica granatum]|uniref:Uncharacterized protein n=1 Tax=Punica granatum TaxID=22663 RepID=A0A2I0KVC0_PUNGR|nr:hypothetical protein CRG98_007157 [Punica granatum]